MALGELHLRRTGAFDSGAKKRWIEIERSEIRGAPEFVVIDVALLSIEVLARVGLPCDSGRSDLPT